MKVEVTVRIDGREVAILEECISGQAIDVEQQTERLKDRVGQVVLAEGFSQLAATLRRPWCCGKPMQNKGPRRVTIMSQSGEISFNRTRYRCRECRQ